MGRKIKDDIIESCNNSRLQPYQYRPNLPSQFNPRRNVFPPFGSSERYSQVQNSGQEALQHQQYLQHLHQYGEASSRPQSALNEYYFNDNFPNINMPFSSLPVLEPDLLTAYLEPQNNSDPETVQHRQQQHQHRQQMHQESMLTNGFIQRHGNPIPLAPNYTPSAAHREFVTAPREERNSEEISGLVTQFPNKEKLEGSDFKISFPPDSPKLVIRNEGDLRRIYTVNDHLVAIFFNHSAGPKAKIRFVVVFSNDGNSITPVGPCKNHQSIFHEHHIFNVSGVTETHWEDKPHPSILVIPCPCKTNGPLMSMNLKSENRDGPHSRLPTSCAQLTFFCRNSCKVRKDLTLICQLEKGNQVLARESFLLKVSACPRRDAKAKTGITGEFFGKRRRKRSYELDVKIPFKKIALSNDEEDHIDKKTEIASTENILYSMVSEAKSNAFKNAMTSAFESLYPDDFSRESRRFEVSWGNFTNETNKSEQKLISINELIPKS